MLVCAVEITQGPSKGRVSTGTEAGYRRHLAAKEAACDPCLKAHRDKHRTYREATPEERAEYNRAYHKANREQRLEQSRAYHAAHRKDISKRKRAYYEANSEYFQAWRDANREKIAEYSRAHYEANPEKYRRANARRRARLREVESDDYTFSEIYERDRGRCQLCGKKVNPDLAFPDRMSASIDHIVPLEHGGHDTRVNIQLAHLGCNASKQTRTIPTGEQLRLVG